jgi:hypothetical protein
MAIPSFRPSVNLVAVCACSANKLVCNFNKMLALTHYALTWGMAKLKPTQYEWEERPLQW